MKGQIEFDYYITPDGLEYNLHTLENVAVLASSGLGMAPIKYLTRKGPYQHGETVYDYRLEPRTIQLTIRKSTCSRAEYWAARAEFLNYLRPNRQAATGAIAYGKLRKVRPDGSIRDIDVLVDATPDFASSSDRWDEWGFTDVIRFIAHNPVWYNPTINTVSYTLGAGSGQLVFPVTFDGSTQIVFGMSSIVGSGNINYAGTWFSFPTLKFTGPLASPSVENVTLGLKIALDYSVSAGEVVTVNLAFGNKTITNASGTNLIGTLSSDSDLGNFRIGADPEAPGGINAMTAFGGLADANSSIQILYYTRYIGV